RQAGGRVATRPLRRRACAGAVLRDRRDLIGERRRRRLSRSEPRGRRAGADRRGRSPRGGAGSRRGADRGGGAMSSARSRKKGQRRRPAHGTAKRTVPVTSAPAAPDEPKPLSRSQRRDAEAREALEPGERPWPIVVSVVVTTALGIANFALFAAGVKPHVSGQKPQLPEILVFTGLMLVCAGG